MRRVGRRRGQAKNDRGEGLGDSHNAFDEQMPILGESCAFLLRILHSGPEDLGICIDSNNFFQRIRVFKR
jgi:hypothetical protein